MDIFRKLLIAAVLLPISAMAEPVEVTATPVPLYADSPDRITVGALTYKGGLQLRAGNPRFGGFSGLGVSADGARMVSISDRGMSLSANLSYDDRGNLNGIKVKSSSPLNAITVFGVTIQAPSTPARFAHLTSYQGCRATAALKR